MRMTARRRAELHWQFKDARLVRSRLQVMWDLVHEFFASLHR